jgi:UDP-N-acetylglucosamine 2-epimerase (non-hydrolysing)
MIAQNASGATGAGGYRKINGSQRQMKVLVVFGTRPEAIKMAPVVRALAASEAISPVICLTGQHRDMLAGVLDFFGLSADHDLSIMQPAQDLVYVTRAVLGGVQRVLAAERPDWVLVHGDTTTALASALAAFYAGCRIGHVEAGLRTTDLRQPWPEEMNRSVIDRLADRLFAPTEHARANLLDENLGAERIVVTGNTVVDALVAVCAALADDAALQRSAAAEFGFLDPGKHLILVTGHRRESFGHGFEQICAGLRRIAERDDVEIVYPVHLNPAVQGPVRRILGGLPNVHLLEPLDYVPFVYLMMRSHLILTDSGGIQEEAPSLGKPVLVMREVTERPEAIAAGTVALVGTDQGRIYDAVIELLQSPARYAAFAHADNPYGDGRASLRIRDALLREARGESR